MNYSTSPQIDINITDYTKARKLEGTMKIGQYFVFIDNNQLAVKPLFKKPVELDGLTINWPQQSIAPISCLISERELYCAEKDNVHLFVAASDVTTELELLVERDGVYVIQKTLSLTKSVTIETLSILLPGQYTAKLISDDRQLGTTAHFTVVAVYTLAPFSARLHTLQLDKKADRLHFELQIDSYQQAFTGEISCTLMVKDKQIASISRARANTTIAGRYKNSLSLNKSAGPFHLRLTAVDNAELVTELKIPGIVNVINYAMKSRYFSSKTKSWKYLLRTIFEDVHYSQVQQREVTVVSNLGQESAFAMMPEAKALPLLGGYLSKNNDFSSPLRVKQMTPTNRQLQTVTNIENLVLIILNLVTCEFSIEEKGNVKAEKTITIENHNPLVMVFVGCFVQGQPFEAYTTFIQSAQLQLNIKAPETDEEGYLINFYDWSSAFAIISAEKDALVLTDEHWEVILFIREYYEEYQIGPAVRVLSKAIGKKMGPEKGNSKYLYGLFPYGPAKQANRYAGLPRPHGLI